MEKDKEIIPVFSTDGSIGKSILTSWDAEDSIDQNKPVSIWTISQIYNLEKVFVRETSFSSFIAHYKQAEKLKKQLIFGIKFLIVADAKEKSEEGFKTESNICVWMRNSEGYKDLIRVYSEAHSKEENFYYSGRLDWKTLKNGLTDNLFVTFPFYSSFIARNLLKYAHNAIPDFGKAKPVFEISDCELPFDSLITKQLNKYTESNGFETIRTVPCYYYSYKDIKQYCVFRSINGRNTYSSPNIEHFSSSKFSFQEYCVQSDIKFNE